MAEIGTLTLSFVVAHPLDAARVLEGIPVADAAELFASLPARAAAPTLTAMLPQAGARVVVALAEEAALGLLAAAGVQGAVTILRHVGEPRRTQLIERLSTATAVTSRLLLGYAEDTVGAWADPDAVALPGQTTAAEALARVRRDHDLDAHEIFVVGGAHRLVGVVDLPSLYRAPETATLAALMRPPVGFLPGGMSLSSAAEYPGWKHASSLPVVERGDRLIGILRATKMTEVLAHAGVSRSVAADASLAGVLARSYWETVSSLLQAGLSLLPRAKPVLPEDQWAPPT